MLSVFGAFYVNFFNLVLPQTETVYCSQLCSCFACYIRKKAAFTGKSLSEALIFASTNPQYDKKLFIALQVQYMKIPSSNLGRTCCVQKLFPTFRTISVHNMFSPCSTKRRPSDKNLPVPTYFLKGC